MQSKCNAIHDFLTWTVKLSTFGHLKMKTKHNNNNNIKHGIFSWRKCVLAITKTQLEVIDIKVYVHHKHGH